jgi:MoxR-like ATPase
VAEASREAPEVRLGLSTRGCLSWMRAAKAWALAQHRSHVVPEDVITLARPVLAHRLLLHPDALFGGVSAESIVEQLLERVTPPRVHA